MPQAEKAAESHARNSAPIDFTAGRKPQELDQLVHIPSRSRYVRKLQELVDAIVAGAAVVGEVYPLGHFNDPGTAANTAKSLTKRSDLPIGYEFELVPIVTGKASSELWAGVVDPNERIENVDEVVPGPSDDDIRALEDEERDDEDWETD